MRAISIGLIFLHLAACAGMSAGPDARQPAASPGPCGRPGSAATGSWSHGAQASDGSVTIALASILLLLGLVGAIAGCPSAAAGGGAESG